MQIEFLGPSSAGKSQLIDAIMSHAKANKIPISLEDQFLLNLLGLNFVRAYILRTILVDMITLTYAAYHWRKDRLLFELMFRALQRPTPVARFEKINLARNILKKIYSHKIISQMCREDEIVLLDEGPLQTAHYLFVHVSVEPDPTQLANFSQLINIPDLVIYKTAEESILIERVTHRTHRRVPNTTANITTFISRAMYTFNELIFHLKADRKLFEVPLGEMEDPYFQIFASTESKPSYNREGVIQTILSAYQKTM